MYRNGVQIGSNAGGIGGTSGTSAAWGNSSGLDYLGFGAQGIIDDCRIYDRVLTSGEERLLASRRGIAYEMAPRRWSGVSGGFSAAWALRQNLIIGGGLD